MNIVEELKREAYLLNIVLASSPPRRFPRGLNGRQQQRDQDADDRDHHQKFNKRKAEPRLINASIGGKQNGGGLACRTDRIRHGRFLPNRNADAEWHG